MKKIVLFISKFDFIIMPIYESKHGRYEYDPNPTVIGKDKENNDSILIYAINNNPKYQYHIVFESNKTKEITSKTYNIHPFLRDFPYNFIPLYYYDKTKQKQRPCLSSIVQFFDCTHSLYQFGEIAIYDIPPILELYEPDIAHDQKIIRNTHYYLIGKPCQLPILRYTAIVPSNPIQFKKQCNHYDTNQSTICATSMIGTKQICADLQSYENDIIAKYGENPDPIQIKKEGYQCLYL